jgi:hypothetical protein
VTRDGRKRIDDVLRARRLNRKMGTARIAREGKASLTHYMKRAEGKAHKRALHAANERTQSRRRVRPVGDVPRIALAMERSFEGNGGYGERRGISVRSSRASGRTDRSLTKGPIRADQAEGHQWRTEPT